MAKELVDCDWVVMEKIDGENASINITDETIRVGKRNSLLGEGEQFGKVLDFANTHRDSLFALFSNIKQHFSFNREQKVVAMTLYGESFGGIYKHKEVEKVNGAKKIQGRVQYCPHNDFLVFDMSVVVETEEKETIHIYVDQNRATVYLDIYKIPRIHQLFIGTFEQCLAYNETFITTIPSYYNLPTIEGNYSEGIVIKPLVEHRFGNGERVIFKKKSEAFAEKMKSRKVISDKEQKQYSKETVEAMANISQYVTENRLSNVMSHYGELTEKDFGMILKDMNEDVLKDFMKDNEELFNSLSKEDQKVVRKSANKEIADLMKTCFFKNL